MLRVCQPCLAVGRIPQTWALQVMLMYLTLQSEVGRTSVALIWPLYCWAKWSLCNLETDINTMQSFLSVSLKCNLMNWLGRAILKTEEAGMNLLLVKLYAELLSWYLLFAFLRSVIVMSLRHSKYFTRFIGKSSRDFSFGGKMWKKKKKLFLQKSA